MHDASGKFLVLDNVISYIEASNFIPYICKRRGNFQGIQLKAMLEQEPPYITKFPQDIENVATYFQINETYDMTTISILF